MIIGIIPAKKNSKRLKNKNLFLLNNKPLLYWTAKYCKNSKLLNDIYVSSESKSTLKYAQKVGLKVILRPKKLCGETPIIDVYKHAFKKLNKKKKIKIIVGLQPDHPDRKKKIRFSN